MQRTNAPVETVPYLISVIPPNRLDFLVKKCEEILCRTPGNVLEVGVYKGGSLVRLAEMVKRICPNFKVYGIDTFTGHPYTDNHPVHPKGKYSDVSLAELRRQIDTKGLSPWIVLYPGLVEQILPDLPILDVSFAHIDCDLYVPVRYCAIEVPKLLQSGSMIYFDDYGHQHCPGATKAVEEVFLKGSIYRSLYERRLYMLVLLYRALPVVQWTS